MMQRREFLQGTSRGVLLAGTSATLAGQLLSASVGAETQDDSPLDPSRKIRVGIVGGGFGASFHWHLHPNCIVHAVSDLREDRRRRLTKVYQCDRSYPSLEKVILDDPIEAVAVFTGADEHTRHCLEVMNSGKHVMCAVPACVRLEEAEQLRDAKLRTGLKYMMAETSYFRSEAIAARELHDAGAFGELFYSEVEYNHPITDKERQAHWYYKGQRTWRHGNAPMLYVTHATAFLVGTTKERLVDVSALGFLRPVIEGYGEGKNQYDNPFNGQVALFKTDRGNACRCNVIWTGTNAGERAQWFGTDLSFFMPNRISQQPMKWHGPGASRWVDLPDYQERLPEPLRLTSGHGGSHTHLVHEFLVALVEDREPAVDLDESLAMTVPGIIANESSKQGGIRMRVPVVGT